MQKKVEIIAKNTEEAMAEAVKKLHISSDKIFINLLKCYYEKVLSIC